VNARKASRKETHYAVLPQSNAATPFFIILVAFAADLFQAQFAIVRLGNPVALTGGVFELFAVHDLHCATRRPFSRFLQKGWHTHLLDPSLLPPKAAKLASLWQIRLSPRSSW
jgi:hypothetical protein